MKWVGWIHILYFGVYLPIQQILQGRKLKAPSATGPARPDRVLNFQTRTVMVAGLGLVSIAVALVARVDLIPRRAPSALAIAAGVATYAAMVGFMVPRWRRAVEKQLPILYYFTAITPRERLWWVILSISAGVSEEITWRGVQVALLSAFMPYWAAALASAVSFSVAHSAQGWRGVPVFVAFALAFQFLVWIAGSLLVAIAVHIAYDVTVGLAYGKLHLRQANRSI